jgi:hypothetical protein
MLYQLPNGRSVEISLERFLKMTDQDLKDLGTFNDGENINDPFALSVLRYGTTCIDDEDIDEVDEEVEQDLTDVNPEEKLYDEDYIDRDNLSE